MKAFIDRVFKSKKQKQKELIDEITNTAVEGQATEAVVEAIIKEVKEVKEFIKKEKHIDCECKECITRTKQNAK
jgi:hypothetical protein